MDGLEKDPEMTDQPVAKYLICPDCGVITIDPNDIANKYCPVCHWQTSDPELGPARAIEWPEAVAEAHRYRDTNAEALAARAARLIAKVTAPPGWVHISVELPENEAQALLSFFRGEMGFREIDWCELQRPDFARVSYGPCEPRTESGFGPEYDEKLREEKP